MRQEIDDLCELYIDYSTLDIEEWRTLHSLGCTEKVWTYYKCSECKQHLNNGRTWIQLDKVWCHVCQTYTTVGALQYWCTQCLLVWEEPL